MEMETHEYMLEKTKLHYSIETDSMKDILFTDTFFFTIKIVQGHTCFQIFVLKCSMYSFATPMKADCFVYDAYRGLILNVGAIHIKHNKGRVQIKNCPLF